MPIIKEPDRRLFVEEAVNDFLGQLREKLPLESTSWGHALDRRSEVETFRDQLIAYSIRLVAEASAGDCDDGSTTAECKRRFRPGYPMYYRCMHAPPHCYDSDGNSVDCP
jgi:hypothetical protein